MKSNNGHLDAKGLQLLFVLAQLRQVLAAGKSSEMPMKDHEEPMARIVFQPMNMPLDIGQLEGYRPYVFLSLHRDFLETFVLRR